MKKIILFFSIFLIFTSVNLAQQLSYRFTNEQLTNEGTTLEFDVEIMADDPGYWLGEHTVSFVYNTDVFGEGIVPNKVTITKGVLMEGEFSGGEKYTLAGIKNTYRNIISVSCLANMQSFEPNTQFHNEIPTNFAPIMHFAITITDPEGKAGIAFSPMLMDGQQYHLEAAKSLKQALNPNLYTNDLMLFWTSKQTD